MKNSRASQTAKQVWRQFWIRKHSTTLPSICCVSGLRCSEVREFMKKEGGGNSGHNRARAATEPQAEGPPGRREQEGQGSGRATGGNGTQDWVTGRRIWKQQKTEDMLKATSARGKGNRNLSKHKRLVQQGRRIRVRYSGLQRTAFTQSQWRSCHLFSASRTNQQTKHTKGMPAAADQTWPCHSNWGGEGKERAPPPYTLGTETLLIVSTIKTKYVHIIYFSWL